MILRSRVALGGGAEKPFVSLRRVLWNALSNAIHQPQVILSERITSLRGALKACGGLDRILQELAFAGEKDAEVVLCLGTGSGGLRLKVQKRARHGRGE